MASPKTLELRNIKQSNTSLGIYTKVGEKFFPAFKEGDILYSKDGKTRYMVNKNGCFRRL
jgi:hypothetical protein